MRLCPDCGKFMAAAGPHVCSWNGGNRWKICADCGYPHEPKGYCEKRRDKEMGDLVNHTCPSCEAWKKRALEAEAYEVRRREKERQRSKYRWKKRQSSKSPAPAPSSTTPGAGRSDDT